MTHPAGLALDPAVIARLDATLPAVAEHTVRAIIDEVPSYAGAFSGEMGATIAGAVQTALGAFLRLAAQTRESDPSTPLHPAVQGAYALGRGEARSGRSMEALLAAYRIGARVAWRDMSTEAVASGLPASTLARFAELVFAYIDQLSAASVAGHRDELDTSGRVRERYLERLGQELLQGATPETLAASVERAAWTPPARLSVVLLAAGRVRGVLALLDPRTLLVAGEVVGLDAGVSVLLVPDETPAARRGLLRLLAGQPAVVGPSRPWQRAVSSYERAARARESLPARDDAVDTDAVLLPLVVGADAEALADLRARVLAPLAQVRPATAERLAETLRAWLLHQGRRDDVAAALVVHPQTVRYRMGQIRELFGDRLADPEAVLELVVALSLDVSPAPAADPPTNAR